MEVELKFVDEFLSAAEHVHCSSHGQSFGKFREL